MAKEGGYISYQKEFVAMFYNVPQIDTAIFLGKIILGIGLKKKNCIGWIVSGDEMRWIIGW